MGKMLAFPVLDRRIFWLLLAIVFSQIDVVINRSFTVGHKCFLKDGQPFRYASGTMHYWRVPSEYWEDGFYKMRAAGLLAVDTYVIWSLHEQEPGEFRFDGMLNFTRYFELAQKHDLLVILRAGPFIAAEVDMGGLPYWLLRKNPNMVLRSTDPTYLYFVQRWYDVVLPLIKPYLYANGGPIITVQVENEYGAYGCDIKYMNTLRDMFRKVLGNDIVLFTNNDAEDGYLKCGRCDGALITGDFGTPTISGNNVTYYVNNLEKWNPDGPLVDSEFYVGWLDVWGSPFATVPTSELIENSKTLLDRNVSFNYYIFRGGTNFGFNAGAGEGPYQPVTTTYDFDAPITEWGDPTEKYLAIRELLGKYFPLPPGPVPQPSPKGAYGPVQLSYVGNVFNVLEQLCPEGPVYSQYPMSFEMLKQGHGFILYRNVITKKFRDPAKLSIPVVEDRAYFFVDQEPVGMIDHGVELFSISISLEPGQTLDILVQNGGRGRFYPTNNPKGILSNVTVDGRNLTKWAMFPLHLPHFPAANFRPSRILEIRNEYRYKPGAAFYSTEFMIDKALDTFLKMDGWTTGYAFLNGRNLGRYWPGQGPQVTLYVPGVFLQEKKPNVLEIFEMETAPCSQANTCIMEFVDTPIINGTVPAIHAADKYRQRFPRKY
ncbi:beta-galactosidase-like [Paramacrobiotus metropolitanus]|uniref:beta-galactosidase-like n=1 Tax=Paramacrobiotus metropolitanus TaxID=2943436 RepID=UPI002445BDC1|nr:beta-galactosidase-like [Paramacrobiotus metropolitanus]XP_055354557.1 beta-galactosidase-like [Paramacrobiotus metropolitanus]XP_055354558.1 beta-galactosidase-like [Paramacrobiotus metropolitanus]XP_055354560.1 beta-galactosidase-like [Paramacrobiotus metropolitanus]XP_055354561.1 beta-galactosidase-like [Paramacrobiotus metropolitanus]XP_055354562.1 beta-galactosidase-like [Paramacrobiotus metropolitanus]